ICIRSVNLARSAPLRDEDRVRPDPREGVRDRFAGFDQIRDPFSLRRESRTEIGARQVHAIVQAVLRVNGGGPRLSRDDVDLPDPVLPLHTAILEDHTDFRIPPPDGVADGHPARPQFLRNLDYRDVADDVKGARQQPAGRGRDLNDILVTPDGHESFLESPSFVGKPRSTCSRVGRRIESSSWAIRTCFSSTPRSRRVRRTSSARSRGTTTAQARMGAAISAGAKGFSTLVESEGRV